MKSKNFFFKKKLKIKDIYPKVKIKKNFLINNVTSLKDAKRKY